MEGFGLEFIIEGLMVIFVWKLKEPLKDPSYGT